MESRNPCHKIRGRLDVTFAGEICGMDGTQTTCITDDFNWAFKKSKIAGQELSVLLWIEQPKVSLH